MRIQDHVGRWTIRVAALGIAAAVAGITVGAALSPATAQPPPVLVFAAASLGGVLDEVNDAWQQETGKRATISYAGSSALARQIEAGAPVDVYISANRDWMDHVAELGLVRAETRTNLLGNRLVLIAPKESAVSARIAPDMELARLLGDGWLAMANTRAVPAGKYGKAALQSLGLWAEVEGRIAQAENVRAALALVSRGEAPLGIVYETDATADPGVRILDRFPERSHPPIVYPAAVLASSTQPEARAFVDYLRSPAARAAFERRGFTILAPGT